MAFVTVEEDKKKGIVRFQDTLEHRFVVEGKVIKLDTLKPTDSEANPRGIELYEVMLKDGQIYGGALPKHRQNNFRAPICVGHRVALELSDRVLVEREEDIKIKSRPVQRFVKRRNYFEVRDYAVLEKDVEYSYPGISTFVAK